MSLFSRIEQACASFVERAFAKTFPSDLEPAQIARKLVTTMGAGARDVEGGGRIATGSYVVRMHPQDFARLQRHADYLTMEWKQILSTTAQRVNTTLELPIAIEMRPDASLPAGAVEIDADRAAQVRAAGPSGVSPRLRLRVVGGPDADVFALEGPLQLGRGEEADVQLADPSVSRNHAMIDLGAGYAIVRDLGSTNGTFVNGERIETRKLMPGDVLTVGKTNLRLEPVQ